MTFVGHGIAGATIAAIAVSKSTGAGTTTLTILAFAALANMPDLPVPCWGHDRYDISHSVFLNLAIVTILAIPFFVSSQLSWKVGGRYVVVGAALAWLSHLLLDSFYNHGKGIALFWPFSSARLALPIPWFETLRKPFPNVDFHAIRVYVIELLSFGTVFFIAICIRALMSRRQERKDDNRRITASPASERFQ